MQAAAVLRGDELGAVLASLGPNGDGRDRLAAVVALLVTGGTGPAKAARGAFAAAGPMVSSAFTSALHSCLRDPAVNTVSPATIRSA